MNFDPKTHQLPLQGKTVLITRSAGQSNEIFDRLQQQGANVIEMPTLEIGPPSTWEALDNAIHQLETFDWLILTSTNGVDYFFERFLTLQKDYNTLAKLKIAVVGRKTAQSLKQRNIEPNFIPPNYIADSLVENFPESVTGKKIMFPRVETGGREVLVKELTNQGANVIEIPAYESRCPDSIPLTALEALEQKKIDVITFASSKTVQYFCQLIQTSGGISLEGICIASIGPQTSKTCLQLFGRVDIEAKEYTIEGLVNAILEWAQTHH